MPSVLSSGVRVNYRVLGEGEPLVLIHGYSASGRTNWEAPGWFDVLAPHYWLIVPDLRGHGLSEKPHRSQAYSLELLARDVLACMDAEGVDRARVFGYSMGGMVALELLLSHAERVSAAVVGGMGTRFPSRRDRMRGRRGEEDGEAAPPRQPRRSFGFFRMYMRQYDALAVAAAWRGVFRGRPPVDASRLGEIRTPVLCVAGTRDAFYAGARDLAARIPGAKFAALSGRGHVSAIADARLKAAVLEFFATTPPAEPG
jgi:pimeloyl-ACP methyl ester carboxylesterase